MIECLNIIQATELSVVHQRLRHSHAPHWATKTEDLPLLAIHEVYSVYLQVLFISGGHFLYPQYEDHAMVTSDQLNMVFMSFILDHPTNSYSYNKIFLYIDS